MSGLENEYLVKNLNVFARYSIVRDHIHRSLGSELNLNQFWSTLIRLFVIYVSSSPHALTYGSPYERWQRRSTHPSCGIYPSWLLGPFQHITASALSEPLFQQIFRTPPLPDILTRGHLRLVRQPQPCSPSREYPRNNFRTATFPTRTSCSNDMIFMGSYSSFTS